MDKPEILFSHKSFQFLWQDPMHETMVSFQLPKLSNCPFDIWGDWGPMYSFLLSSEDPIQIRYNELIYKLPQRTLKVNSPCLHVTRKEYPFFLEIEDTNTQLLFHCYFSNRFELGKVQVLRMTDGVELFSSSENLCQNMNIKERDSQLSWTI